MIDLNKERFEQHGLFSRKGFNALFKDQREYIPESIADFVENECLVDWKDGILGHGTMVKDRPIIHFFNVKYRETSTEDREQLYRRIIDSDLSWRRIYDGDSTRTIIEVLNRSKNAALVQSGINYPLFAIRDPLPLSNNQLLYVSMRYHPVLKFGLIENFMTMQELHTDPKKGNLISLMDYLKD